MPILYDLGVWVVHLDMVKFVCIQLVIEQN